MVFKVNGTRSTLASALQLRTQEDESIRVAGTEVRMM
jgi:hypothetical protein